MSSTPFRVRISGREQLLVRMSGAVNETADFSPVKFAKRPKVEIDLEELTMINSVGLRSFGIWAASLGNEVIEFSHCPKFFIDQVNMIAGLIPPRARVISFYVPYFCDELEEERLILYRKGLEFERQGDQIKFQYPEVQGPKGEAFVMDVMQEKYFAFLKKFG